MGGFIKNLKKKPEPITPIFSYEKRRLLFLDGDRGSVACRVHSDLLTNTIPHFSPGMTVEAATRSLARMNNLKTLRGPRGASMIGPADYYGNVENPHKFLYTFDIEDGKPMMKQHLQGNGLLQEEILREVRETDVKKVGANWISGKNKREIEEKKPEYANENGIVFGDNLFPNSGILEIEGDSEIHLPYFDPENVDFSSFKARLVKNEIPFKITDKKLSSQDEYRAISYLYEPGYADHQVNQGGGLFLETHEFAQTITPLDEHAKGYVTLGRWVNGDKESKKMELIAIRIPYGYTLIVEADCIHGDTTLDGAYMMCMTSNHVTMRTADTVYLKSKDEKKNISIIVDKDPIHEMEVPKSRPAPHPHVIYKDDEKQNIHRFLEETKDESFIFNPFSSGFRKRGFELMLQSDIPMMMLGAITGAVGVAAVVLAFAVLNTTTFGVGGMILGGVGIACALIGCGIFASSISKDEAQDLDGFHVPFVPSVIL